MTHRTAHSFTWSLSLCACVRACVRMRVYVTLHHRLVRFLKISRDRGGERKAHPSLPQTLPPIPPFTPPPSLFPPLLFPPAVPLLSLAPSTASMKCACASVKVLPQELVQAVVQSDVQLQMGENILMLVCQQPLPHAWLDRAGAPLSLRWV